MIYKLNFRELSSPMYVKAMIHNKDLMQGKLFQRCTHLLYCSVLSVGGNVNTIRMSKPEMGSIFHMNNQ